MSLRIKRIYEPADGGGKRILVDRLWPRDISKSEAGGVTPRQVQRSMVAITVSTVFR
ncbi:uncharacterized protein YeaO (DUF488 family) [Rhizobium sp. BK491]|nr:uncharacterized protein YeaO (DUF488 family) [Rhizobium sp. BK491]